VTFCGDRVKLCEDFAPNLGHKRTGCCITTTHRLTLPFSPGNFLPKTAWLPSPTHSTVLFPRLKIKLKGRHFDTAEVLEAELQVVLNALTERDSQDAFKKWQKRWERCVRSERDYFKGDGHL
jgi:hypothetical protein